MGQNAAAVAASMGKAKIRGLIVDRREVGAPGEFEAMDADALRKWIADAIAGQLVDVTPDGSGLADGQSDSLDTQAVDPITESGSGD